MNPRRLPGILLVTAGLASCSQPATPGTSQPAAELRYSMEDLAPGSLPAGFEAAETNGRGTPGRWVVDADASSPDGQQVLRLAEVHNRGSTFNLLLLPQEFPADVRLSVRLRADRGEEDQGGGLVWRARDAANYYVARWNPLEDNLRAYKVVDSKRSMLRSADLRADPSRWHTLAVEAIGDRIRVSFDGEEVLSFRDGTFAGGGRVGLWTKADAATSFDDLRVWPHGGPR